MNFDPTKPVQTRDGREAGIYATDGFEGSQIHGFIKEKSGKRIQTWWLDGFVFQGVTSDHDLVNVLAYPPLPEVEGGRLEIRPDGWDNNGERCIYAACPKGNVAGEWLFIPYQSKVTDSHSTHHYAEFIPDEPNLEPYTLETWPFWATRIRPKGRIYHGYVGRVTSEGVQVDSKYQTSYNTLLESYEIAGTDGEWKPAGQEESK